MADASDISSLSELSDNDEPENRVPRNRVFRDRQNHFEMFNDEEFKYRYRFSKNSVMDMLNIFGHELEPPTRRNKSLSSLNQLLIALRFYATGAFQQLLGDHNNVAKSTICRTIKRVSQKIAALKPVYIKMPRMDEIPSVKSSFYAIRHFPGVIGAIDCTHVRIQSPGGNNAELFRNRKGYFSLNIQAVCDSNLRIRNIISRWPGSVHDSTIFNDCPLKVDLEHGLYGNGSYLLGDNGYACKKYLLTPFLNPNGAAEEAYNAAHIATRNTVERCFGLLKKRFPCLHTELKTSIENSLVIIVACSVLHNLAIDWRDNPPQDRDEHIAEAEIVFEHNDIQHLQENTSIRTALVRTRFAHNN